MKLKVALTIALLLMTTSPAKAEEAPASQAQTPIDSTPAPAPAENTASPAEGAPTKRMFYYVGLAYNTASSMYFSNATSSGYGQSANGNATIELKGAPSIFIGAGFQPQNSWGVEGGLNVELKRDITDIRSTSNAYVSFGDYTGFGAIQFTTLEANALYRWKWIYLPFGLSYSFPKATVEQSPGLTLSMSGGVGTQAGIGVFILEHLQAELLLQILGANMKGTSDGFSVDYGYGSLADFSLRLRAAF